MSTIIEVEKLKKLFGPFSYTILHFMFQKGALRV